MAQRAETQAPAVAGSFAILQQSFRRAQVAENKSANTVRSYVATVAQFGAYLAEHGMPTEVSAITREHVESFIGDVLARTKPATASVRYRGLHVFFEGRL